MYQNRCIHTKPYFPTLHSAERCFVFLNASLWGTGRANKQSEQIYLDTCFSYLHKREACCLLDLITCWSAAQVDEKRADGTFLWLFGWDTEPMADEVLNDRWRALGEAPACQTHTVSLSDIIRKMLSPCACVMFKGWNYIFTVNKLLVSRVTCFVRLLYIIVFNDSPGVQACMSDKPTACWFLSATIALCVE